MGVNNTLLPAEPMHWEARRTDRRELPCCDLDDDCYALDGRIPFGSYARCHAYDPSTGKCPFLFREFGVSS